MSNNYVTVYSVPIDVFSATSIFLALMISSSIIRYLYWFSDAPPDSCCYSCLLRYRSTYQSAQSRICVNGIKALKFFSLFPLVLSIPLLDLASKDIPGNFFAITAINKGVWALIRFITQILICVFGYLFDSHQLFRVTGVAILVAVGTMDLCSHLQTGTEMYCLGRGLCKFAEGEDWDTYEYYCWRDFFGATANFTLCVIAVWLWFLFGIVSNDRIYLPKKEHRNITKSLDQMNVRTKITAPKRLTDEEVLINSYLNM